MVKVDSWETILTPEQRADLKAALKEDRSTYLSIDEVLKHFGLKERE